MDWIDILNAIVMVSIMFSVGTSLSIQDFKNMLRKPKAWIVGMSLQVIFLPLLAFALVVYAPIDPVFKMGIVLLALCPGGTTSNFISYLLDADVTLSVSLTIVNSVVILFTIPLFVSLGWAYFLPESKAIDLLIFDNMSQVLLFLLAPTAIGFVFNLYYSKKASNLQKYLKWLNLLLLAVVYSLKFLLSEEAGGSGITSSEILMIVPYLLLLHLLSMFFSRWGAKRLAGINNISSTTIGIEVGLQNTTLAILISASLLGSQNMSKPALLSAIFTFFTTISFSYYFLKMKKQQKEGVS